MSDKKQTCILVLGMHRSGTSALAGVLSQLDVYLGSDLMEATVDNQKGYFENNHFYEANEELLSQIGSSWDDPFYHESKLDKVTNYQQLKDSIQKEFAYSKIFAIKDPRLVYLFPIYQKVLEELNINIKIIIPYRNPMEVAQSLLRRNSIPLEKGILLWVYNVLLAEKFSRGLPRVFFGFEELIEDTQETIEKIEKELSLNLVELYRAKKDKIDDFLEPNLKHYNLSTENLSDNIPDIVKDIILRVKNPSDKNSLKKFDMLRKQLFGYQKLFYNETIHLILDAHQYNAQILEETQERMEQLKEELTDAHNAYQEIKTQWSESQKHIEYLNEEINRNHNAYKEVKSEWEQSQKHIEYLNQELSHASGAYKEVKSQWSESQEHIKYLKEKHKELDNELQEHIAHLKTERHHAQNAYQEIKIAWNESQKKIVDYKSELRYTNEKHEEELDSLKHEYNEELSTLKQQLYQTQSLYQEEFRVQKGEFRKLFESNLSLTQEMKENKVKYQEEIKILKEEIVSMYSSKSWRVTRPLRRFVRMFKR